MVSCLCFAQALPQFSLLKNAAPVIIGNKGFNSGLTSGDSLVIQSSIFNSVVNKNETEISDYSTAGIILSIFPGWGIGNFVNHDILGGVIGIVGGLAGIAAFGGLYYMASTAVVDMLDDKHDYEVSEGAFWAVGVGGLVWIGTYIYCIYRAVKYNN
jgi:hypothetical protein